MRNTKVWRLIISLLLLSPFFGSLSWAQLENGKVYNFVNVGNSGKSLVITSSTNLTIATTSLTDYKQLWYVNEVSDDVFTLRNLANGQYLCSPNATGNVDWTMVSTVGDNCKFSCSLMTGSTTNYVIRATNTTGSDHYMHYGSNTDDIVCWSTTEASQWTIAEVSDVQVTEEYLNCYIASNIAAYQTALSSLFTDNSCTTLNGITDETTLTANSNYQVLPSTLQNMAKKVLSGDWEESNYVSGQSEWGSSYALKYRVQLYEPYNEPEAAASALRINAHTNINNPTGIVMNAGDVAFIFVEGEIKDGASLYLSSIVGHGRLGGYSDGIELKTGVNIIPWSTDNSSLYINYVVKTFDTSNGTGKNAIISGRELSGYPDLKIHIEGGHINGYWNKVGDDLYEADTDDDWDYIKARATQTDVTVLGKYMVLQFPLTDEGTGDDKGMATFFNEFNGETTSLSASINEWDNVMLWERLLMGVLDKNTIEDNAKKSPYSDKNLVFEYTGNDTDDNYGSDYSEYYNVHGLAFGTEGGYMYGSWDHSGYNYNTMESILLTMAENAVSGTGSHWGPGHEIGHQHQEPLNMRGLTEVTNNLFANVVLWYFGETTSRYNGDNGSLTNVLTQYNAEGTDFFSNNIWAQTIMYYKLFLYYHVLGNNTKFYPRLFEMLRQDPMTIQYDQDGAKCLLHFYKKCCYAAGEDLTEFFRAYGFFEVMENRYVGDYSSAYYNMTQEQIDEAIAEIKNWANTNGKKENLAVLFINDATGEEIKSHKGDNLELYGETTICAELGNYATYTTAEEPSYTYTVSGNTITMTGAGGVGFVLLDNETGEIIGFSDKTSFELSAEAMEALINGEAAIAAISSEGTTVEVEAGMAEDQMAFALLAELIEEAEEIVAMVDDEGKKVGFYKGEYVTDVEAALAEAKEVYINVKEGACVAVYNKLRDAIEELKQKDYARNAMKPGTYYLKNRAYAERFLSMSSENVVNTSTVSEATDTEKWVFESGDAKGVYYVKNLSTGLYLGALTESSTMTATATSIEAAKGYKLVDMGDGLYALTCQDENAQSMHSAANDSYQIVGWNAEASASQWYLTALEVNAASAEQHALEELIAKTDDVLSKVANTTIVTEGFDLGESNYYTNAPCTVTWYGDQFTSYSVLFDEDPSTYLHTDYSDADSKDGLDHYLRIDLGESIQASLFTFKYQTRTSSSNQNPTAITVEGSNSETEGYELIANLTREVDGLVPGAGAVYTSDVLGLAEKSYRYLRFTVTGTIQGATAGPSDDAETTEVNEENKHVFFVVSEFGVSKATCAVTPLEDYDLTSEDVTAAFNALRHARYVCNTATTADEYTAEYAALEVYYEQLQSAYETGSAENLTAKKAELQALIEQTEELMNLCGTVEYTPGTFNGALSLQTEDEDAAFWLSSNAEEPNEGAIENLIDGNNGTFFHSTWSSAIGAPHYLQVDMSEANALQNFIVNYTNKHNLSSPYPTLITVSGSNSLDDEFAVLATFDSDDSLPTTANGTWTSPEITSTGYRYIRFTVNTSDAAAGVNCTPKDAYYCFAMAEFGLTSIGQPASYVATMQNNVGKVTEDLLISTYRETASATSTHQYANTEEQIDQAIEKLQAEYDALLAAYEYIDKGELLTLIEETQTLVASCYETAEDESTRTFKYAGSLYIDEAEIATINEAIAAAQVVYDDEAATAATYNATLTSLQKVRDTLDYDIKHALLPVMVTTDATAPVIYRINIKRNSTSVLAYDNGSTMVAVSDFEEGNKAHAWYFMDNAAKDGKVLIMPYYDGNTTLALASNNFNDGDSKVKAVETGAEGYVQEWSITANANNSGWYNITCLYGETTWYFSNHGGPKYKMGFYNDANDGGSLFNFNENVIDKSEAYYQLKNYYTNQTKVKSYSIVGGSSPGYYPVDAAEAYNSAYAAATALLNQDTIVETHRILSAEELNSAATVRTIGIKCVQESSYNNWVSEATGFSSTLAANTIFSLEPANDGQSGSYYLKAMSGGDTGYFQQSGYALGTKDAAQVFVPVKAIYQGGSGNTEFGGGNADVSGASDLSNLVRFVLNSEDGATYLNPGFIAYNGGTGVWTVYNVYEVFYNPEESATDADYTAAYEALKAANEALVINNIKDGAYYVIQSVVKDNGTALVYADPADNKMYWSSGKTAADAEAIWTFEENGDGTYTVSNLHTGTKMNEFIYYNPSPLSSTSGSVTLTSLAIDGQWGITAGGTMMHAQDGGAIVHWSTGANDGSAWRLVEVEDMSSVKFELEIGQYEHAGMYLNYPVTIPEGVVVKYPNDIEVTKAEGGKVTFVQVEDELPARTGVIVEAHQGSYTFYYNTNPTTEIQDNLLLGSAYTAYLPGETNWSYYLFGVKNNLVGFYMAYLEYNEDGSQTVYDEEGNAVEGKSLNDTDNGTHFRVGANKVYLPYDYSISGVVAMFNFGDTVTDIDGVETDLEHAAIYDLSGRRIERITTSGIYIVNGRKQYVRASQMK